MGLVRRSGSNRHRLMGGLVHVLDRLQPSQTTILISTALATGIGAGIGAIVFRWLIEAITRLAFTGGNRVLAFLGAYHVIVIPALGGLLVGPLIYFFAREARGHGVPEVMEAIALRGGRIRPIVAVIKALASSICIGTGGSVGREGPIAQIGSALGSTLGQWLRLSDQRVRNLVACGAAGGIAATFNAPIAGTIFALEVILGEFSGTYFSTVVISSVTASVIGRAVFGDVPAFAVPPYSLVSLWEFPLYVVLGVLAAVVGLFFVLVLYRFEDIFNAWQIPEYLKPAVGGVLIGVLGFFFPHIFGVGYGAIEQALHNGLPLSFMALLLLVKLLATSLTLGSGGSGGIFAPSLFLGAMLGGSFGTVVHTLFPTFTALPGAYALVGMAAVFAAAAHAPITSVLILFEMTGDYRIILPLMLATVMSTFLAERAYAESIYTLKLSRRGIRLLRGRVVDIMEGILVGEAMSVDVETVPMDMPVQEVAHKLTRSHHHGFMVLDENKELYGIVSLQDVEKAMSQGNTENLCARDIATTSLLTVYPDDTLLTALERLDTRDVGRLPVVDPQNPKKIVGLIRRYDIIRAYHRAILRREAIQQRLVHRQLEERPEVDFVELVLDRSSPAVGRRIDEIPLPYDALIVAIRRNGHTMIPHGNTVLKPGDHITVFAEKHCVPEVQRCFVSF
ncbi:MAG: CBS domain-containing protein [Nitrospinota bacterium]|nr:MAG: CBS domain-containing protein [Nitrospinota bacterium]